MQTQKANWVQWATGILALFLVIGVFGGWYSSDTNVTTEKVNVIQKNVTFDFTDFSEKLEGIQTTLDEEDNWEETAIELATDEWSRKDYKYIYRFLEDIDEKEDIDKIVIKDEEVTSFNVDDQDATIVQELKVYYENLDGDDVKVYLTVTTYIEDGDVEDQDFEFN